MNTNELRQTNHDMSRLNSTLAEIRDGRAMYYWTIQEPGDLKLLSRALRGSDETDWQQIAREYLTRD